MERGEQKKKEKRNGEGERGQITEKYKIPNSK